MFTWSVITHLTHFICQSSHWCSLHPASSPPSEQSLCPSQRRLESTQVPSPQARKPRPHSILQPASSLPSSQSRPPSHSLDLSTHLRPSWSIYIGLNVLIHFNRNVFWVLYLVCFVWMNQKYWWFEHQQGKYLDLPPVELKKCLSPLLCLFGERLSRAHNLHLLASDSLACDSKSTQMALREYLKCNQRELSIFGPSQEKES